MNHHTKEGACPLCEEKLLTAHPLMREFFRSLLLAFPGVHISWAWRGKLDQDKFVAEGKSNTPFPMSKHNYMIDGKPCALALDLFTLNEHGVAIFPPKLYHLIFVWAGKTNFPHIEWAGNWTGKLKESCHFQTAPAHAQPHTS